MIWLTGVFLWLACGVIAGGLVFACWQRNFPLIAFDNWKSGRNMSIFLTIGGPIALLAALPIVAGFGYSGFLFPTKSQRERARIIQQLARESFK